MGGIKHTYTLDGTKILREAWGNNTLIPLYDNEDSVCGILYNNVPYYFIKNLQGDIIAIVDKDAQTVARYSYDAWGVCTVTQDTSDCRIATVNPFRYRGYYYDEEIGLYYLQSRYYDQTVCRFLNADRHVNANGNIIGYNMYAYCSNIPIIYCDVLGNALQVCLRAEGTNPLYVPVKNIVGGASYYALLSPSKQRREKALRDLIINTKLLSTNPTYVISISICNLKSTTIEYVCNSPLTLQEFAKRYIKLKALPCNSQTVYQLAGEAFAHVYLYQNGLFVKSTRTAEISIEYDGRVHDDGKVLYVVPRDWVFSIYAFYVSRCHEIV